MKIPFRNRVFRLVDRPTKKERERLGVSSKFSLGVRPTGEFRPPKAGEWYLSGAIPEGYRTMGGLLTSFYICKLVKI